MENLVLYILFGAYALLVLLDAAIPARTLPKLPFWRLRGLAFFGLYFWLSSTLPFLWDEILARHRWVDLTHLGVTGGAVVGFLVLELGIYAWHRSLHRSPWLWRWFHQMHHSSERHDIWSAMIFSPLDMIGFTFIGSLSLVWVVGLVPEAALLANLAASLMAFFTHANLRTPRWLGYIVQRPEAHALHHARGIHRFNYSDLPVIDMIFGTFRNPKQFPDIQGFAPGASSRIGAMLLGRDVSSGRR
ncbi:MAG: sterol desaturase family protein [Myxococcota bacterium]